MPIDLNGTLYQLAYFDTNVVSEISKRDEPERSSVFNLFVTEHIAPCYSPFSIIEIKEKPGLFKNFISTFGILPSAIVLGHDQLTEEEIKSYPDPSKINPIIASAWGLRDPELSDPREKLQKLIELSGIDKHRINWNKYKPLILKGMRNLPIEYPSSGDKYTKQDAKRFVNEFNYKDLCQRFPWFIQKLKSEDQDFNIDAFPSLKMRAFTEFHRFCIDKDRRASESDVFDVLMSTILPYVDIAYVESYQAEVLNRIKRIDPFISKLKVRTLRDLRKKNT
jgi:hypothetical protein